jgi:hypothetical protein
MGVVRISHDLFLPYTGFVNHFLSYNRKFRSLCLLDFIVSPFFCSISFPLVHTTLCMQIDT